MDSWTDTKMQMCICSKDLVVPVMGDPVHSDSGYSGACHCFDWSPYQEAVDRDVNSLIAEQITEDCTKINIFSESKLKCSALKGNSTACTDKGLLKLQSNVNMYL